MTLQPIPSEFIYEENFLFFFISVPCSCVTEYFLCLKVWWQHATLFGLFLMLTVNIQYRTGLGFTTDTHDDDSYTKFWKAVFFVASFFYTYVLCGFRNFPCSNYRKLFFLQSGFLSFSILSPFFLFFSLNVSLRSSAFYSHLFSVNMFLFLPPLLYSLLSTFLLYLSPLPPSLYLYLSSCSLPFLYLLSLLFSQSAFFLSFSFFFSPFFLSFSICFFVFFPFIIS